MDKNTLIGFVLIAAILIGFGYWNQSQLPPVEQTEAATDSASSGDRSQVTSDSLQAAAAKVAADSASLFPLAAAVGDSAQAGGEVVLQNDVVEIKISPNGGVIKEVNLKKFRSYDAYANNRDEQLNLFCDTTAALNFQLATTDGVKNTAECRFEAINQSGDSAVTMRLASKGGDSFDIEYHLLPNTYMVNATVKASGGAFRNEPMGIQWTDNVRQLEKGYKFEHDRTAMAYKETDGDSELVGDTKNETEVPEKSVDWVAFKNQYFSAVMIAGKMGDKPTSFAFKNGDALSVQSFPKGSGFIKRYDAQMEVPLDPSGQKPTEMQFYFGPNKYRDLQKMEKFNNCPSRDLDLQEMVYLGWPIVKWINRFFTIYVFDILTGWGLPMGIVLLLITLLLRVIVYPTTRKSFLSSAKMRVLKPKVDELNKKYPNPEDAMKKQQEMMQIYSQYGVSPMGGCLPALIQMPIWIAMFNFVPNAIELRQEKFLWAEDLSAYDSIWSWGKDIWAIGDHLSLFCLLFCGTNILYSLLTMRQQRESMSSDQNQQMKVMQWMMFLMPVIFFFMFNEYSSGLNYYYFISLLASALTMWYLRRTTDDAKILAKLEENYKANKANPAKKPTGWAARLQALQEQQAEMMRRQQQQGRQK